MPIKPYDICAVIVSFNGGDTLTDTYNALVGQVAYIVIVDNGSDSESIKILKEIELTNTAILYNNDNHGVAFALNQGVRYAIEHHFRWVLTMDQDSIADKDMVKYLMECAQGNRNDNAVSFSPAILLDTNNINAKHSNTIEDRYTVITSGNLLNVGVFENIGMFEEKLFIDSVDFEFCLRLKKHGYRIIRCNKAILLHSLGDNNCINVCNIKHALTVHSPFRKYYIMRNHIFITLNYLCDFPAYCIWKQVAIIRLLLQIIFLEKNKIASLHYVVKGLCDGICNKYGALRD